jgi:hypothetical protein
LPSTPSSHCRSALAQAAASTDESVDRDRQAITFGAIGVTKISFTL